MDDQKPKSSYLLQMPPLVITKILSNILNLTNVSRTCKSLYEVVCGMEKRKRILCIRRFVTAENSTRLTIDDDAVFDSIMNSLRTITTVKIDADSYRFPKMELNERQLERLGAILKRFGSNITVLMLCGIVLSIDRIIDLLNQVPNLESLQFASGKAFANALHLDSLKKLEISFFRGLMDIVNLIPAGLLNHFCSFDSKENNEPKILQTVLAKQQNIKYLHVNDHSYPAVLCLDSLHLETFKFGCNYNYTDDQLMEILKFHMNLKELRLTSYLMSRYIQPWLKPRTDNSKSFKWICDNLKDLEILQMPLNSQGKNVYSMLGQLKKLRHLHTDPMPENGLQFKIYSLEKLKIDHDRWLFKDFISTVFTMIRTFPNLTDLKMQLTDFSEHSLLLSYCTTLIVLSSFVEEPKPHQLAQKCFPNIRHLTVTTYKECDVVEGGCYEYDISQGMNVIISIVRAMPNLKSLWMPCTTAIFNMSAVKEFIHTSKSLEELSVSDFKLDRDLDAAADDLVETIRRLSDQLKAYRFTFTSDGHLYSNAIKGILSNEFNVHELEDGEIDSTYFDLSKGVLNKFCKNL